MANIEKKTLTKRIIGATLGVIAYAVTTALCRDFLGLYIELVAWGILALVIVGFSIGIAKNKNGLFKTSILCVYFCVLIIIGYTILSATGVLQTLLEAEDGMALYDTLSAQYGNNLYVVLIVFQFLQVTFIPIASSIVTAAGFYLCGQNVLLTILFCCVGLWAGSLFAFFLGRTFGVKLVKWVAGEKVLLKYQQFVKGKDKVMLGYMFIFPVYPDDVLCLIAGLTAMSWREFIFLQLVSRPLNVGATVIMLYLGTSMTQIFPLNTPLGIAFWVAVVVLFVFSFVFVWKKADLLEKFMNKLISKITGRPIISDISTVYKLKATTIIEENLEISEESNVKNDEMAEITDETVACETFPDNQDFKENLAVDNAEQERKEQEEIRQTTQKIDDILKQDYMVKF